MDSADVAGGRPGGWTAGQVSKNESFHEQVRLRS